MPSTPLSTSYPTFSSSFSAPISLRNWWLIKSEDADGKRLAVGGYHYPCETKYRYVLTSAPVVKRIDAFTLETADGYILRLQGGINRSRTQDNGFPPEVSDCFFIGFPYNWGYYAKQDFGNDPMVPRFAAFFTSCESSLDDMVIKKSVSSSVNTDVNGHFSTNASVQSETISRYEKDSNNDERCAHLINTLNVNYENQNETRQRLQAESFSNKRLEINNENINFENTFDSVNFIDDVSSREGLSSSRTQQCSQQVDNTSNMDPVFRTRKLSSLLEASFESPQAYAHRNVDTENNPHSGIKDSSTILSPFLGSLHSAMKKWKPVGLSVKRNRVDPPNDDSDVPTTKRARRCYMLMCRDAKTEHESPNNEKFLESNHLNLSKLDYTEYQNAICIDNTATLANSSTGTLKDSSSTEFEANYLKISRKFDCINSTTNEFLMMCFQLELL